MYIHKTGTYIIDSSVEILQLKHDLKKYKKSIIRRINRFILLALVGAHKCLGDETADIHSSVYLTTENGNLADTENILASIHERKELPMPFGFVNTMSNTAAFYVAQSLGIEGVNITVSSKSLSFERGLELLQLDMQTGRVAKSYICGVDEAEMTQNAGNSANVEGSGWLYIASQKESACGRLAEVCSFPGKAAAREWCNRWRRQQNESNLVVAFGNNIPEIEQAEWKESVSIQNEYLYRAECGYFPSVVSCGIAGFIEQYAGATLLHVNCDENGRYALLVVERF